MITGSNRASRTIAAMNVAGSPSIALPPHIRDFIAAPHFGSIATVDADGSPRQAIIWYLLDGDELVVNSRVGRRWRTVRSTWTTQAGRFTARLRDRRGRYRAIVRREQAGDHTCFAAFAVRTHRHR